MQGSIETGLRVKAKKLKGENRPKNVHKWIVKNRKVHDELVQLRKALLNEPIELDDEINQLDLQGVSNKKALPLWM